MFEKHQWISDNKFHSSVSGTLVENWLTFLLLICLVMLFLNSLANINMSSVFVLMIIIVPVILMLIAFLVILILIAFWWFWCWLFLYWLLTLFSWSVTYSFSNDVSWLFWPFKYESDSTTADCISNKFLIISFFVCSSVCKSLIFPVRVLGIFVDHLNY